MAGRRVDDISDNVFHTGSRINSTWGGGLADMVRSRRLLEIIERDGLFAGAGQFGARLLASLHDLAGKHPALVSNVRGRGLMCALDLPEADLRSEVLTRLLEDEHVLALSCGTRTIRFRPHLAVTTDELDRAVAAFDRVLSAVQSPRTSGD